MLVTKVSKYLPPEPPEIAILTILLNSWACVSVLAKEFLRLVMILRNVDIDGAGPCLFIEIWELDTVRKGVLPHTWSWYTVSPISYRPLGNGLCAAPSGKHQAVSVTRNPVCILCM